MRLLFVTDFHLRNLALSPSDRAHAESIARSLDEAAASHLDAEMMVIGGDIADAGDAAVYEFLKPHLDALPFPVVPILGNHDDRSAFLSVFQGDQPFVQRRVDLGGFRFLCLDTLDEGRDSGVLCRERLDWIAAEAATAKDRPIAIFMHHPPCEIGDMVLDPIRLANAGDLVEALGGAHVVQIFFGHVHRTVSTTWNGIPALGLARPAEALPLLTVAILGDRLSCTLAGSHY